MGDPKGFIKFPRVDSGNRPVNERIHDFAEVEQSLSTVERKNQSARCMDCGVPFCNWACPVYSKIPEWQDALSKGTWQKANAILHSTNDFPEFTGRVCPAPCEKSCTLNLHEAPVTIRENEKAIVERQFADGYILPKPPKFRTGKKVAVIGSGPAGLSAAARLNQAGHTVTVFEKDDAVGGLLRYGIPDFKLAKTIIDRRISILKEEGIEFKVSTDIGKDISAKDLIASFDAICLAVGAMKPRDINVPGRELKGIYFAMDYLKQQNKILRGTEIPADERINAKGKKVLVIGGGDTGSDCVGTANRQGAQSVIQIEILAKPPEGKNAHTPWPYYPHILKTSSSHEEGCERRWGLSTKDFIGENGSVKKVEVVEMICHSDENGAVTKLTEKDNSSAIIEADLVLLAMGFTQPVHEGLLNDLGVQFDARGNVIIAEGQTNIMKVFAAGDAALGASLVVRAIYSGRVTAEKINKFLGK